MSARTRNVVVFMHQQVLRSFNKSYKEARVVTQSTFHFLPASQQQQRTSAREPNLVLFY